MLISSSLVSHLYGLKCILCPYFQYSGHNTECITAPIAQEYAHVEDILCVAFGAPNLMGTASFDGQVRTYMVEL